jgi:conjugative relaxase-like TrwC/TraI family protein
MLTISKPLNAGQAQSYHVKEFTAKEQNYWSQQGAALGEWQGKLADRFGLAGAFSGDDFARLSQGQHPVTEEQLVRHRLAKEYQSADGKSVSPMGHRAGWDATFSAPKSVSLTALVGGDSRVREAHRQAVNVALTELERYTQARIGGNNPAEQTGKFIAAKFEHDTARPVEGYAAPQLHTHAVIFNMTERDNGQYRAVQPQSLFQSQQFATAVYQSELMYRLSQLGYEWTAGRSGAPEVKGYTQEYLDASSPRSQQIREHLERRGFAGPEAAQIAAHATRDKKAIASDRDVLMAHRALAAEFGNQADRVVAGAQERALQHRESMPDRDHRAKESVTFARDRNFEREAVIDQRLLYRDALRRGMGQVTYPDVRQNFEARHHAGEFLTIEGGKHDSGRYFTTRQTIAQEQQIVRIMREGQNQLAPIMPIGEAIRAADANVHLNKSQRSVIEDVLISADKIQGLQGLAGTGKTSTLAAVRQAAETKGYEVTGLAPTSRAAQQLQDGGVVAGTLQGFLARGSQQETAQKTLYLVDESSLASTRQMQDFLQRLGPQERVLFIGDTRQHQGVEAGRPFEQLQEAGMHTSRLDQIIRQKDPELKLVVEHLSRGETATGIDMLRQQGRVTEIASPTERIAAIAKSYVTEPANTLIVSLDNVSRQELNQAVRQELKARNVVNSDDMPMRVLTPRQDMTGADRNWASRYEAGDILRYSVGSRTLGIRAGSYVRVIVTNPTENLLTVQKNSGEEVTYDPRRLKGISAYRELELGFAVGDRIQFTASDKQLGVSNRELATVEKISRDGEMSVRTDKGRELSFDPREHRHFDHGYAVTSHSSQGLTSDRVLINVDTSVHPELLNSRFAYVAVSRGSEDVRLFTNDIGSATRMLSTEIGKSSALELTRTGVDKSMERSVAAPEVMLFL